MKTLFKTLSSLYNGKLILVFLFVFIIIRIPSLQVFPDFLNLNYIESQQSYILTLLSVIIGFSSFILTILLLLYNSFSKTIRRNSFDFVFENPWIKITFSLFGSSLIFLFLTLVTLGVSDVNTRITLMYFSSFIAFGNLLIQFPLLILSVKYSSSYEVIEKLISRINEKELENLYNPSSVNNDTWIKILERNSLIQLKDIGIVAIKENDWALPQTIVKGLYDKLINTITDESESHEFTIRINAFNFIIEHFKKIAIEESDIITVNVLLTNLQNSHIHLARKKVRNIRHNPIDKNLIDLYRMIIENNDFYSVQQRLLSSSIEILREHFQSFDISDEQVPTIGFLEEERNTNKESEKKNYFGSDNSLEWNYYYYLKSILPDLFLEPLKFALKNGNRNVYSSYINWQLHSFMDLIAESKTLSVHQQNDLFREYSFKARQISSLAIEYGVYNHICFFSNTQIVSWISVNKKFGLMSLYEYSYFIKSLNNQNKLYSMEIDDYFAIGRQFQSKPVSEDIKLKVLIKIIETGFEIYDNPKSAEHAVVEIKMQLQWLYGLIEKNSDFVKVNKAFGKRIVNL